jgi:hyaluronoglucosaminidase
MCSIGTLAACGLMAHAQTTPPAGGTGGTPLPIYWNPTGPQDAAINFSGLPIQTGKSYMFYQHLVGKYPRVWTNPTNGVVSIENEGIPQRTNWNTHVTKLRRDVIAALPDPAWDGTAILDFESWHPTWATLAIPQMKTMSRDWVRARFPNLNAQQVEQRAAEEFEAAGMDFMVRTMQECKALRPRATWGFYGFPYNYPTAVQEQFRPLFDSVDAFFLPMYAVNYSVPDGSAPGPGQRPISVYNRSLNHYVELANTWGPGKPVYSIVWMRYHEMNPIYGGQFINDLDLQSMFREPWRAGIQGVVFWDAFPDASIRNGYNSFFAGRGGQNIRSFLNEVNPTQPPIVTAPTTVLQPNSVIRVVGPPAKKAAPFRALTAAPTGGR